MIIIHVLVVLVEGCYANCLSLTVILQRYLKVVIVTFDILILDLVFHDILSLIEVYNLNANFFIASSIELSSNISINTDVELHFSLTFWLI